jgi:translation initiation factor IF-3
MSATEALRIAQQKGLDLIEIVPNSTPPVCKIMDFGKFKYEQTKKDKIQRKNQHVSLLKEVRFHPNTDTHDFEFKTRHAINFLEEGHKVKATVVFKGREITYKERGRELLYRFAERLTEVAKVDQEPKLEGRMMVMIFAPDKSGKKKVAPKEGGPKEAGQKEAGQKEAGSKQPSPKEKVLKEKTKE